MKYDNELFLLSEFFSHNTINKKDNREISDKKRKLFRIVLKEFRKETNLQEGFCKIKFMDRFWGECDKGYTLVKELVENDAFKSFSKDYLIYITDFSNFYDDSHSSFYELTWDYQTYFEFMRYHKIIKELMDMPENVRNVAVESISRTIESTKQKLETNKSLCPKIGHSISKWHKMEGENGKSPFWYGTCTKCGETQITRKDPNGIKLERYKKQNL